jgi:hypothetical protein
MQTWVIVSWVFVAILTGINIYFFLKLKESAEQMLKAAFPGAKDMNEAVAKMQQMMKGMGGGMGGLGAMAGAAGGARPKGANGTEDQLAQARKMLERMQAQKSGPKSSK